MDFKAPRELWNPPSKAVPGKIHGSGGHSKCSCLQDQLIVSWVSVGFCYLFTHILQGSFTAVWGNLMLAPSASEAILKDMGKLTSAVPQQIGNYMYRYISWVVLYIDGYIHVLNSLLPSDIGDTNLCQHWLVSWQHQAIIWSPEPIQTYHQNGSVAFTWGQFHKQCLSYYPISWGPVN